MNLITNLVMLTSQINLRMFGVDNCSDLSTDTTDNCDTLLPEIALDANTIGNALRIMFAVLGFVAVVYIIIAGFNLVTSQGDPQAIAKGRQTIIYAGVGLAVVFSAEAVITLVMGSL